MEKKNMLLVQIIDLYVLVVVGAVIVSWIRLPEDNPIVKFFNSVTEPILTQIRRYVPTVGGVDFSPFILLLGLQLLRSFILS